MNKAGFVEPGPPPCPPPSYSQVAGGYPAPNAPYAPSQMQPAGPPIVTTVIPLGPHSTRMICPSCHAEITSSTESKPGLIAYVSGLVIALLGGWCGCCLIPCCIDDCMDVHHNCPNCQAYLGRYRR